MSEEKLYYLWVDFETDGEPYPCPIEIGAMITDSDFQVIGKPFESVIFYPESMIRVPAVRDMHTTTGLIEEIKDAPVSGQVSRKFNRWLMLTMPHQAKLRLAGSGVSHYDFQILKEFFFEVWHMLDGFVDYAKPTLDIGVLRRYFKHTEGLKYIWPEDDPYAFLIGSPEGTIEPGPRDVPHRALFDVKNAIATAHLLRGKLIIADCDVLYNGEKRHNES